MACERGHEAALVSDILSNDELDDRSNDER